ncbi:hypothetical protein [Enterobacter kobei]|jgi:flagellar basal body-associated protein FliL|uniref:hypothetical protein n=1 Tax=Enterobacter kobei TaxID=208224 RepID=UPI0023781795|nr:hypothetical protein [Enterobacter kobei]MDD9221869.1 hypothetical protein [Enterobacter kobei]
MFVTAVVVWCVLVVLFAWFGKNTGPQRVFKAIGYASVTLLLPVVLIIGGVSGFGFYQDAKHKRAWAENAPERAATYDTCVAKSEAAAANAFADKQAGKKPPMGGEYVTDVEILRELNGCPSK